MDRPLPATPWHARPGTDVAAALDADPVRGLDAAQAAQRLARHGPNALPEGTTRPWWRVLVDQLRDIMVVVLAAAAVVAGIVGEPQDAAVIAAILVLNTLLGVLQELRAERAMQALRTLTAPAATVRRDGQWQRLPAEQLVPGDLVQVEAGGVVPADLRLLAAHRLRVDEAMLTGESLPAEKRAEPPVAAAAVVGDRHTLLHKGTRVADGRGEGVVVATGADTALGRIAALLATVEPLRTPLQQRLHRFAVQLGIVVAGLCVLVFAVGLLRGEEPLLMFLTALSLAVAAMPEALPAVVTVALALGARRMARRHALIRRLPAVETLGSVTVIASDKTGTLTQNRMAVQAVVPAEGAAGAAPGADGLQVALAADAPVPPWLARALVLANDADGTREGGHGDPMEVALLDRVAAGGGDGPALRRDWPRLAELPFSSARARMTTLHAHPEGGWVLFLKGAPEQVLPRCTHVGPLDAPAPLDGAGRAALDARVQAMAHQGLRVLAVAARRLPARGEVGLAEGDEREACCLGLVGLADPPRPEAAAAVAACRAAGIRVVMITGDHPDTAAAIARAVGIADAGAPPPVTGAELAAWDDATLAARCDEVRVYARVAPEEKIRVVRALQARGAYVAMTGDGVNDAPALQQADIGVAMGRTGTDVAREASAMVLADDHFATIVAAVEEGRRVYDNVRKFIRYILTGNSAELWLLLLAPLFGLPIPLLPIHILWVNLVTDGLPAVALSLEPAEPDVMRRPPRPPTESVFAHGLWQHALLLGLLIAGTALLVEAWAEQVSPGHWQTMVFTVLALAQLGHVLAARTERVPLWQWRRQGNPALWWAVGGTAALQVAVLYVPLANRLFKVQPLTATELGVCMGLALVAPAAVELEKWRRRVAEAAGRAG
jgi:Ca2+-transporting ATPase